jgi:transmembrane sensor
MNTDESAQIRALLLKHSKGECTPQEQELIEAWYARLDEHALPSLEKKTEDAIVETIRAQVLINATSSRKSEKVKLMMFARIAAALLLIPVAYLLYTGLYKTEKQADIQFITKSGEQKILTLPDSTEVVLNSSSKLTLSPNFGINYRKVILSGEGYFRVKHDVSKPFIITTGQLQTRVLGTEFNVHAYPNEKNIKVAVVKGRVKVSEERKTGQLSQLGPILTHNLMLNYNIKTRKHLVKSADSEKLSAWQNGRLYFEDATIEEIALALQRRYNKPVELADKPTGGCRYTIDFGADPLPKVLAVLGQLSGINYQYTQNKVIIHSKQCH